ncbi:hypothetical protein HAX54_053337, partial [Datura stramonium]|nr:hypothetical protein [Datura stramonium]
PRLVKSPVAKPEFVNLKILQVVLYGRSPRVAIGSNDSSVLHSSLSSFLTNVPNERHEYFAPYLATTRHVPVSEIVDFFQLNLTEVTQRLADSVTQSC